jgi:hypothetical protein
MPKSEKYIMSSDYATLANDSNTATITVPIPATSITSGTPQEYTSVADIGTIGSPIEYDISSSMTNTIWKGTAGYYCLFVENTGAANQYQYIVFVLKSSATQVTVRVIVFYGGGGSITKTARTVTVRVRTFIPPFA